MKKTVILIMMILIIPGLSLAAQDDTDIAGDASPFVRELIVQLRERDWNEEEIREIALQARELSWQGTERADAELVAYALSYEKRSGGDLYLDDGLNRARIALELAVSSMEMEALGFTQQTIARAAVHGVSSALEQVKNWRETGKEGRLGEMIRETVQSVIRKETSFRGNSGDRQKVNEFRAGTVTAPGLSGNFPQPPF